MANTPITELDFQGIKRQLRTYLRNQSQFKDYNFEGSNMSVLLDVLAYNTFQNNFYTNMAINEMFLDSAQLENSVVSHAKELNYLPRSSTSASARVRLLFRERTLATAIEIPKFTEFRSTSGGVSFTFVTDRAHLARRIDNDGNFVATEYDEDGREIGIEILEGTVLSGFNKEGFFGSTDEGFKCVLNNENIDIRSIEVFVDDETVEYTYRSDIFGAGPTDTVFYIEPDFDRRYAVVFGQNVFGRQPDETEDIKISYRICNEEEPNGASVFSTTFRSNVIVETLEAAQGGRKRETIESVKYFAPRSIQIQERAITTNDYETLLRQRFPEIQSIAVYGGDEVTPPQFGRVVISVNLRDSGVLSNTKRAEFQRYIADKSPLTIEPVFVNPEFLYAALEIRTNYSKKFTEKTLVQIEKGIREVVARYNETNLNDFGAILRASKLLSEIDDSDESILSSKIHVRPIIEYRPTLNRFENPFFDFKEAFVKPYPFDTRVGFKDFKPTIKSSVFVYEGQCAILHDDGNGKVMVVSSDIVNPQVLNPSIGTVDYDKGTVKLINFITTEFSGSAIKIYADTITNDIISPKSRIFAIRDQDVVVKVTAST
jgi:YD repeat-containing protein